MIATTFSHDAESLSAAHYLIEDVTGVQVRNLAGEQGISADVHAARASDAIRWLRSAGRADLAAAANSCGTGSERSATGRGSG